MRVSMMHSVVGLNPKPLTFTPKVVELMVGHPFMLGQRHAAAGRIWRGAHPALSQAGHAKAVANRRSTHLPLALPRPRSSFAGWLFPEYHMGWLHTELHKKLQVELDFR